MSQSITINRPDDWHVHFRDGKVLEHTVSATAKHFGRALIMPNLKPALTTASALLDYRQRILAAIPNCNTFTPFMTLYLNEQVCAEELHRCAANSYILGAKLYPAGATTNSDEGARSLTALYPLLEIMQHHNLVLQIHGEVTYGDIFEREELFIINELTAIISNFPRLRIVLEHISTQAAVNFVINSHESVAATITAHHLLYNRNQLLAGGIKPHYYCLPILKHERDRLALCQAATSGNPKFFAGTDSAPHAQQQKENACGCAGAYTAPFAIAMYAQVFDSLAQSQQLNGFLSHFGAQFYQLPINEQQLVLIKQRQDIPASLPFGSDVVIPLAAGTQLEWSCYDNI